jgi:probable rRNA maturation factor
MQGLNLQYRGKDYATDVLSFSYRGEKDDNLRLLGEIIVCPDVAATNASRWNTSVEREMRRLLAHGILHLTGYDHETDDGEMQRLQRRLLARRVIAVIPDVLG